MLYLLCSVRIAFFVYHIRKRGDEMKSMFTIYNQRLAGYLMMNGFTLLKLSENARTGKNDFIFANVPMLQDYIDKWQNEKLKQKNRRTEN